MLVRSSQRPTITVVFICVSAIESKLQYNCFLGREREDKFQRQFKTKEQRKPEMNPGGRSVSAAPAGEGTKITRGLMSQT